MRKVSAIEPSSPINLKTTSRGVHSLKVISRVIAAVGLLQDFLSVFQSAFSSIRMWAGKLSASVVAEEYLSHSGC